MIRRELGDQIGRLAATDRAAADCDHAGSPSGRFCFLRAPFVAQQTENVRIPSPAIAVNVRTHPAFEDEAERREQPERRVVERIRLGHDALEPHDVEAPAEEQLEGATRVALAARVLPADEEADFRRAVGRAPMHEADHADRQAVARPLDDEHVVAPIGSTDALKPVLLIRLRERAPLPRRAANLGIVAPFGEEREIRSPHGPQVDHAVRQKRRHAMAPPLALDCSTASIASSTRAALPLRLRASGRDGSSLHAPGRQETSSSLPKGRRHQSRRTNRGCGSRRHGRDPRRRLLVVGHDQAQRRQHRGSTAPSRCCRPQRSATSAVTHRGARFVLCGTASDGAPP